MTKEKFEELVVEARPRMMAVVYKFCRDRTIADEATQTALLYFLERLAKYQRITPALLISVAVNRAKNLLRDRQRFHVREYPVGTLFDLDKYVSRFKELDDE